MSPTTKSKMLSAADVDRVFDVLRLTSDEQRRAFQSQARPVEKQSGKHVYVTWLSNSSDAFPPAD